MTTLQHIEADVLQLKGCLFEIGSEWQAHWDDVVRQSSSTYHYRVQSSSSGQTAGRPRFDISRQQLEYLSSMNFSWTQIADLLGVSRMTIYRRRHEFGLLSDPYTTIDDGQLRSTIRDLRTQFPEIGESIMWGHLRAMRFHVQRERVRRALREIDPLNTALRWRGILTSRRPYCVPGPNSLWHIGMHYCIYFLCIHVYLWQYT